MAEIFQQFGGMMDAAHNYKGIGQTYITDAADHQSLAGAMQPQGAWCSSDFDEYFMNVQKMVNEAHAHGTDLTNRGTVVDQCAADGQATLATTTSIASSLRV
ncbi:hypothetical protein [Kribbella sp. CA-247076]|uniref:hypothetical protein n=1 Tax=Kribbella sp. CA-247076 TaxID=3239941 RepID=UPI003D90E8AA